MKIDQNKCIGCQVCLSWCPNQAILVGAGKNGNVYVDQDLCYECGLCRRMKICPTDAFVDSDGIADYPRVVRSLFSDPNTTHKSTLVPGRGTEESKTNDVSGRTKRGEVGICIEFGRPGVGCTFEDISILSTRLKKMNVEFMTNNALTAFMNDETGLFPEDFMSQRVLSAIIEIVVKENELEKTFEAVMDVAEKIDTVFSLSVISRFDEKGELPVLDQLTDLGINYAPNAKVNLGLGIPLVED